MSGNTGPEHGPEQVRYTVAAAAERLGISDRAVRKRIQAGTLKAEPNGRTYWVYLEPGPEGPEPGPVPLDRNGPVLTGTSYRVTPGEIEQAIEHTGDKYVADMRAMFERVDDLYRDRLADKDRLIVELEEQRDALRSRVSALEAQQVESLDEPTSAPEPPRRTWWRFWEWET